MEKNKLKMKEEKEQKRPPLTEQERKELDELGQEMVNNLNRNVMAGE